MQFFEPEDFPALARFARHWRTIRNEVSELDPFVAPFDRDRLTHEEIFIKFKDLGKNAWIKAWGPTQDRWLNYGFRYMDTCVSDALGDNSCPRTMALVGRLSGVKVVALSLFKPGTYLLPHAHPELAAEGCLTFHLGLSTPPKWHWLNVDGVFRQHTDGEAIIFDGSRPHFAINFSQEERLILYLEFFRDRINFD